MAFGFAGAAVGANQSLEEIVAQRILQQKLEQEIADRQARIQLDQDRLGEAKRASLVDEGQRQQTIDLSDRTRRDRNNASSLELMKDDRASMDMDSAIGGLPAHLKPLGPLMKAGGVGKISPEDVEDPAVKAKRAAAAREQAVQDQIRVRNATREPKSPEQVFVKRGEQVIPIQKGTAIPGDIPYDQVAARSSQPTNQAEAVDTAREAARIASELRQHKGMPRAFGVLDSVLPTFNQSTADAESLRDALTSLLTLENMGKMKGVLSDSDMKVLRQASTTLNARMGDKAAASELDRIVQVMGKVTGDAPGSSATPAGVDPKVQALIDKYGKKPQ